ncbi:putative F-box protein [Raphanus sativus]|uniref:F-box protein At3g17560 n=1 Tax=Raphanus sativus TaxID=3726 RepID=A0A9W3DSV9_RAPSA|nr:putative F-box protein At3g17560 [Raphanus sativus]XP_056866708.1 putative F-box protein At3g17560 [Raphanus sativus]KAJ4869963.1 putative F-box protein [Raphanus sativus]KAJ4897862.1 putative F-box protein [Raphanus sativus]
MISTLPQELVEEILSRVPVTSLRSLRSTCKGWFHQALFKDPRFIKKHFDKTRQYHALMLNHKVCSVISIHGANCDAETIFGVDGLTVVDLHDNVTKAFHHCDGLLLCTHPKSNMLVVRNPFSGKTRWIQQQKPYYNSAYAMGYDKNELCHNYKILRLPCYYDHGKPESWKKLDVTTLEGDLRLEIYEFGSNSWRSLDAVTTQAFLQPCGVSLKGDTYWLSSNHKVFDYSLLSFDFSKESLQRLCVPSSLYEPCDSDTMALSVVREEHLLLLYQSKKTLLVEIWITDEIETTFASWCMFLIVDLKPHVHFIWNPMSFFITDMEKEVVLCCHGFRDVSNRFCVLRMVPSGISRWYLPTRAWHVPTLFGYVPAELA